MAALQFADARALAEKRFPRSRRYIYGSGYWGIAVKCPEHWTARKPWLIFLFKDQARRDHVWETHQCPSGCFGNGNHEKFDLWPSAPTQYKPASENAMLKGIFDTR